MARLSWLCAPALSALCTLSACGDDDGDDTPPMPDAAAVPDALNDEPDGAMLDAAPAPSFGGTISLLEVSVAGHPELGQGLQLSIRFEDLLTARVPVYEEMPGSVLGCLAWEYAPDPLDVGLDEGVVAVTVADGAPVLPLCEHVGPAGYVCSDADDGAGTGPILNMGGVAGTMLFTDTDVTTFGPAELGRYVRVAGATNATNNGMFPIVGVGSMNTLIIANPAGVAEVSPGTWTVVAGVGPIPGAADPGFLADADEVTVALTPGGAGDLEAFSVSFTAAIGGPGDDFTLDTASAAAIVALPLDGTAFTLGCDGAGGSCTTVMGSVLSIVTTDGDVTGLPAHVMPPAVTTVVEIRCASLGVGAITVPAAAAAALAGAGATRVRTTFLRANFQNAANTGLPQASTSVLAGHGVVGFTTP